MTYDQKTVWCGALTLFLNSVKDGADRYGYLSVAFAAAVLALILGTVFFWRFMVMGWRQRPAEKITSDDCPF